MRKRISVERSRALRKAMTPIEWRLWYQINRRQLNGVKFRRQAPIGPYIVDFVSHEAKLVIELDGDSHGDARAAEHDEHRTRFLEGRGFRVIRFWNSDVYSNLDGVMRELRAAVGIND